MCRTPGRALVTVDLLPALSLLQGHRGGVGLGLTAEYAAATLAWDVGGGVTHWARLYASD